MPTIEHDKFPQRESKNVLWSVDPDRKLLFIELRGGVSDYDLLKYIPRIWKEHPEVVWFNSVVDVLEDGATGNWTWGALQQIAKEWKEFAQDRNPHRRVAVLTENYWITQIVNRALGFLFIGQQFHCFRDRDAATEWAAAGLAGSAD
ncbi:STAS/SEC14 domain-containing protein [Nisaea sp.]|uniref:STAS/SEC14 domain-containing protein n=1 Tax=Nisaea sp. TaxID=2024842 RepID=UPI003B51F6FD